MNIKALKQRSTWVLAGIIILFVLIKLPSFKYSIGDENVYFYMGKLLSDGQMMYKDFFFAHPPVQLFIFLIIFKIFGFSFIMLKSVSLVATIVATIYLYKLVNEKYDLYSAIASIVLFLSSYQILSSSSYNTGISLTLMFIMIGVYYSYKEHYFKSGIFLGFAGLTGLYSVVAIVVFSIIPFINKKDNKVSFKIKGFKRYIAGLFITLVLINLLFLILFGSNYFTQVYKYHLIKPRSENQSITFPLMKNIVWMNPLIFLSSLIIFFNKKDRMPSYLSTVILYFLFFAMLNTTFPFYFSLMFPFLAILGGVSLVNIGRRFRLRYFFAAIIFIIVIITAFFSASNCLWRADNYFVESKEMNEFISSTTIEDDLLFGDSTIVPLLSLISDRDIALHFVDTNYMRIGSGLVDIDKLIEDLKQSNLKYIVIKSSDEFMKYDNFKEYINENCFIANTVEVNKYGYFYRNVYPENYYFLDCS